MITILTVVLTIVAVYIIQYFFKLYNDAKARKNFKHEKSEEQNENQRMNIDGEQSSHTFMGKYAFLG